MAKSNIIEGLFGLNGRAPRSEWWLIGFGLSVLAGIGSNIVIAVLYGGEALSSSAAHPGAALVRLIASLIIAWPILAVSVRRAHDRNNSGWLVFVYQALNLGLGVVGVVAPDIVSQEAIEAGSAAGWTVVALSFVLIGVMVWLLITLGFLPGKREPNRYGQPQGGKQSNYRAPTVE